MQFEKSSKIAIGPICHVSWGMNCNVRGGQTGWTADWVSEMCQPKMTKQVPPKAPNLMILMYSYNFLSKIAIHGGVHFFTHHDQRTWPKHGSTSQHKSLGAAARGSLGVPGKKWMVPTSQENWFLSQLGIILPTQECKSKKKTAGLPACLVDLACS